MPESRLGFEDIAMLRAWSMMADDCEGKIRSLVTSSQDIVKAFSLGEKFVERNNFFTKWGRRAVGQILAEEGREDGPTLWAGVTMDRGDEGASYCVWIESPPHSPYKRVVRALHDGLHKRNAWNNDAGEKGLWDVWRFMPLEILLAADDQGAKVREFVETSLRDLVESGLEAALRIEKKRPT